MMSIFDDAFHALDKREIINPYDGISIDDIRVAVIAFAEVVAEYPIIQPEVERDMLLILCVLELLKPQFEHEYGCNIIIDKPERIRRFIKLRGKERIEGVAKQEDERKEDESTKRDEIQARVNHGNFKLLRSGQRMDPLSVFAFF